MLPDFKKIKVFLFDLDETVWYWDRLVPRIDRVIMELRKRKKRVFFVTNNPVLTRQEFADRLNKFGIIAMPEQIHSTAYFSALYFQDNNIDRVYVVGEAGLVKELEAAGIEVSEKARHVLLSVDRNFNYWKLKKVLDIARHGAKFYSTGTGVIWRIGDDYFPAEMSIVSAVKSMTGEDVKLLGKPSSHFRQKLLQSVALFPDDTVLVGDDAATDIRLGNACGFKTVLVTTGVTRAEDVKNLEGSEKPDLVFKDAREILRGLY